jgi:hypothetical protein
MRVTFSATGRFYPILEGRNMEGIEKFPLLEGNLVELSGVLNNFMFTIQMILKKKIIKLN